MGRLELTLVGAVALGLTACGNKFTPSPRMADAPPAEVAPNPAAATIVVLRPSTYAGVLNPSLYVDGQLVADLEASRRVVLTVPPGQHLLIAGVPDLAKGCRQLTATVEANKIYYVHASVAFGAELTVARPADAAQLKVWLGLTQGTRTLSSPGTPPFPPEDWKSCQKYAAESHASQDAGNKAKQIVGPADGFAAAP